MNQTGQRPPERPAPPTQDNPLLQRTSFRGERYKVFDFSVPDPIDGGRTWGVIKHGLDIVDCRWCVFRNLVIELDGGIGIQLGRVDYNAQAGDNAFRNVYIQGNPEYAVINCGDEMTRWYQCRFYSRGGCGFFCGSWLPDGYGNKVNQPNAAGDTFGGGGAQSMSGVYFEGCGFTTDSRKPPLIVEPRACNIVVRECYFSGNGQVMLGRRPTDGREEWIRHVYFRDCNYEGKGPYQFIRGGPWHDVQMTGGKIVSTVAPVLENDSAIGSRINCDIEIKRT